MISLNNFEISCSQRVSSTVSSQVGSFKLLFLDVLDSFTGELIVTWRFDGAVGARLGVIPVNKRGNRSF